MEYMARMGRNIFLKVCQSAHFGSFVSDSAAAETSD
jgi:hypothetical protein